ncbi:MAG: tRNA epoxyqueuosine(34) reductase QueG, partial [Pseudomonadota bacterium]|nr:tRNA epoxyqueuosine(34) reductase QueG [Pseudomonadota bacterium]
MIVTDIRAQAANLGFSAVGITRPEVSATVQARFDAMVAAEAGGDIYWVAPTAARRRAPPLRWPAPRPVILVGP